MSQFFGEIFLVLAILFALGQSVLPLLGYLTTKPYLLTWTRSFAFSQFVCVAIAYLILTYAFAINDFTIAYVATNSHANLPLIYRLTAVWGAHEGSILLWILILAGWTLVVCILQKQNRIYTQTLGILGVISLSFLLFIVFTSNPFLTTTSLSQGQDLNPLLQDPGFVIHPPMLYIGYVGLAVAFAVTQAALLTNKLDYAWAYIVKCFTLAAWGFLTLGITLGSWWAYRVLGWGGFWFWDPVENASLLPWLTAAALVHILVLTEKRDLAKSWAVLLTIICFALSLFGTFLVRSGLLISAHSFANDPARGLALLILFAVLIGTALTIYVIKIPTSSNRSATYTIFSREMSLRLNNILLMIMMLTILLGTLFPIILEALQLGSISVGAPYFNKALLPLVLVAMFAMGLAAFTCWQNQSFADLCKKISKKLIISIAIGIFTIYFLTEEINIVAALTIILSSFILLSILDTLHILPGMALGHAGFAILALGILLSSVLNEEHEVRMQPGNTVVLGPYLFSFVNTQSVNGPNYKSIRAKFEVTKNKKHITTMYPEKRLYTVREMVTTNVAIDTSIFRDLYLALGEPLDLENNWSVRLHYKPFIRWIWSGGMIMMLGGLVALLKYTKFKKIHGQ